MLSTLQVFFLNDDTGGNPVEALARNLTGTTGASGDGAMALDYVHATLASKLLAWTAMWGSGSSAHGFDANDPVGAPVRELLRGRGQLRWNVVVRVSPAIDFTTENREAPLARLNPGNDTRGVAALLDGKGTAVAHLILDALGRQSAGAVTPRAGPLTFSPAPRSPLQYDGRLVNHLGLMGIVY